MWLAVVSHKNTQMSPGGGAHRECYATELSRALSSQGPLFKLQSCDNDSEDISSWQSVPTPPFLTFVLHRKPLPSFTAQQTIHSGPRLAQFSSLATDLTEITLKNVAFWDIKTLFVLHRRHITSPLQSPAS
jgi:hypothetical protein